MSRVITTADRASFKRCRRQWDFRGSTRQNLEPLQPPAIPDLDRAVRDALAVYYYPGMWDWDTSVRLLLAVQGLDRAVARQRERCAAGSDARQWQQQLDAGRDLLTRYFDWAPTVDQFSPVLIEADYEVNVLDPASPVAGLVTAAGQAVRYTGRIDLLAVDRSDAYWIVRHRVVEGDWQPTGQLLEDEETLTACWAWEQFYLGMAITGVIYNELQSSPQAPAGDTAGQPTAPPEGAADQARRPPRRWRRLWSRPTAAQPAVRQHEPSGGGRSIPQLRRMYARAREPDHPTSIEQRCGDGFRRTWLRRSPADVAQAGRQLGLDVTEMTRRALSIYPTRSDNNCPPCPFREPCRVLSAGQDAALILRSRYRQRPPDRPEEGRLGGGAWGMGRGAAPPKFRADHSGLPR